MKSQEFRQKLQALFSEAFESVASGDLTAYEMLGQVEMEKANLAGNISRVEATTAQKQKIFIPRLLSPNGGPK